MPPSGEKFPICWKMHRRASHAIFIHRKGFSTFRRECVASQCVAGPYDGGKGLCTYIVQCTLTGMHTAVLIDYQSID